MNKKFSTLMAGLLLAGGMSSVKADTFKQAVEGQYYRVVVNAGDNINERSQWLDVDANSMYSLDKDKSTLWTVKKVARGNGQYGYKLINVLTGEALTVKANDVTYDTFNGNDVALWFDVTDSNGEAVNAGFCGKLDKVVADSKLDAGQAANDVVWYYRLDKLANTNLSADLLNDILGDGFGLRISKQIIKSDGSIDGDKKEDYVNLEGNPFVGQLYAVNATNGVKLYQGNDDEGKQIVLTSETWGSQGGGTTQEGFKFAAVNDKEYAALKADGKIKAEVFTITRPSTVAGEPLEVAMMIGKQKYELVVTDSQKDGHYNLTVAKSKKEGENFNDVADYTYQQGAKVMHNTWVRFGFSNATDYSDFYGKLWNITKDGQVASPVCDDKESFLPAAQVALDYPEGQWLYYDEDGLGYKQGYFQNRESGKKITLSGLRDVEGKEYTYTDGESTYTITPAGDPSDKATVGYLNGYTEDLLKQKAFFIGTPISSTKDTVYLAKAANGKLEFTTDKADAVEFRLTMADFDSDASKSYQTAQTRTVYTIWDNKDAGTVKTATDVVSFHQYTVTDAVSGEVLKYDAINQRFAMADAKSGFAPIVLKNKGAEIYNLLYSVATTYVDAAKTHVTNQGNTKSFCAAQKLYGAHNANELVKAQGAYKFVQNDLFVVVDADAQQYRGDFSENVLDTIKIFRNDDNSYVLYEKGTLLANAKGEAIEGFLGMENINDPKYKDMHAAMLADTAFHAGTFRPQYMLAVDAEIVADGWTCPLNPEHNTTEWREEHGGHCADAVKDRPYIQGRYLVNLVDSAMASVNPLKNKFTYEMYNAKEPYYRLGFVQAKHIGDSLIIASTNDTIDLKDNPYDKVCTFAFKYVDAERDAFTIETLYKTTPDSDGDLDHTADVRGYVKYHNGVPVVTPKSSEAWVFDLEVLTGEENAPTANESINAANNVVVAGVNGAVVVKGAEGKNVIVSTILGKVVANEVVSSDNATIAAPAGVVVVSVDGESFKVVVK